MKIVTKIEEWRELRAQLSNVAIGFVPTMGNLHVGHLALCQAAQANNDKVVVSIFVNPTQFNQANDFDSYPRTLEADIANLTACKVDYLFLPDATAMYPDQFQVQVSETELSRELEGEFRPGHFTGMLTVVIKLLNLIQATRAYFGEKDYQQLLLVKKMVAALFIPTQIIGCATVRAEDGLALSSRNSRLNKEERQLAKYFPRLLMSDLSTTEIVAELNALGFKVEYIKEEWQRRLGAVQLGNVRLIDNVSIAHN